MPSFTLNQMKAHDPFRHISITANAGSGKTRVLVSRYCDLVEYEFAKPPDIAAITFTEKAAAELRSRIAKEFEDRLSDEGHKERWATLKRGREQFTSAVVTTIHGFCSQLLREFPIEADVPPNFAVISGYERSEMEDQSLMEAIEEALGSDPPEEFRGAYGMARRIGREKMEEVLRSMLWKREAITFSRREGVLKLGREETLMMWMEVISSSLKQIVLGGEVVPAIHSLIGYMKDKVAEESLHVLDEAMGADDVKEFVSRMQTLFFERLLTKSGGIRKGSYDLKGEEFVRVETAAAIVQAAAKRVGKFFEASPDWSLHEQLYDDATVLLAMYDRAMELYAERKERSNALDFEDLQLVLMEAFDEEEARERMRCRYKYVMVDEFQDTNELQYNIVLSLLDNFACQHHQLCIVGDEKQSIYGFRNAEVAVFREATVDIQEENRDRNRQNTPLYFRKTEEILGDEEEQLGVIRLNASFRLLPSIDAYVNTVCAPIMQDEGEGGFGVNYEPLVCARISEGKGGVEYILATSEPGDDEEEGSERSDHVPEAELIARRLKKMVEGDEEVVWERNADGVEVSRPVRYSDMALLCRKRSMFPALEVAFRKYGIPYLTHGSTGFFKAQEVYDVVNYLRALLNSRDEIALLGVLRSPFFAVSDAELYRISRLPMVRDEDNDLWSRAVRRSASEEAEPALKRAVTVLADDRSMASRIPVSLLLRRIIERSGWRGAVIGAERGEQMLANVDKLMEMAREFESQGFTNLFDFVERVTTQIDAEEVEGEAPVNSSRDAVRLMTMHGAKGLEFPVVVLPMLHSPVRQPSEPYFDKEYGFGWNWKFNQDEYRPMITALMHARQVEKEKAEEARLFYVATTRARDMLILSGEVKRSKEGEESIPTGTMLEWAMSPFEGIPETNTTEQVVAKELAFLDPDGATTYSQGWEQEVAIYRTIDEPESSEEQVREEKEFPVELVRIGELPARAHGEIYSASQFLVYSQCPTKYYLKYRLGLPEELDEGYEIDPDTKDSDDGTRFARLFRTVVARIDEMVAMPLEFGLDDSSYEEVGTRMGRIIDEELILEVLPSAQKERMRSRLLGTLQSLLSSKAARSVLFPPGATMHPHHELRMPFGKEFILGVMDRMMVATDGTISVLHFKTLRLGEREPGDIVEQYLPQLRLYAYLASKLNPEQKVHHATVLFTERPDDPQEFTFSQMDMIGIEEEVRASIEEIRAISYIGRRELPYKTQHCKWCAYFIQGQCLLARSVPHEVHIPE